MRCSVDTNLRQDTKERMQDPVKDASQSPLATLGGYDNAIATIAKLQEQARERFRGGDLRQLAEQDAILALAMMGAALATQMDAEAEEAESELEFGEGGF